MSQAPRKSRLDYKDMIILRMLRDGSPSIEDMKRAIMVRSTGTVHNRLEFMQEKGLVNQPVRNIARSRKVTSAGIAVLEKEGFE